MGEEKGKLLVLDQVPLKEAKKNSDGTWDICCVTPGWGSSGYYSEDLLKTDGVRVMQEGLQMFWDHPTLSEEFQRPERSLRDLAGVLATNATYEENGWNGPGVYSKAKVFPVYEEWLNNEAFAEAIGLSLVSYGTSHMGEAEGETGDIIDQITAARSVDFVTLPGRGGKVKAKFESLRVDGGKPEKEEKPRKESVVDEHEARQLRESVSALKESEKTLKESVEKLEKENGELKESNDKLQERLIMREARDKVDEVLSKVKNMPDATKKRLIESISKKAKATESGKLDVDDLKTLIESELKEEAEYLKTLGFDKVRGLGGKDALSESEDVDDDDDDAEDDDDDDDADAETAKESRKPKTEKRLESAMGRLLGDDEKKTKLAVAGRS